MNSSSTIKKNFAWSSLLTLAGYIFPIITFPYVTRVLGVEGIGNYQYADSVIQYFCIFALLGINTVGIREIAKVKECRSEMTSVFSSLLFLCLITTLISIIALVVLISIIPSFIAHDRMLYIGIARILSGSLLIEWFFKGIEDFRFITVRAIIVRLIYVICVFIFVREADDYVVYFLLTTLVTVVNAVINLAYSRRYVSFSVRSIRICNYLKPFFVLGLYQILTAMYLSFNVMYLGAKCGDIEVGFYSASTKLYVIIMSFFTAFTSVMLPRMSSLIAEGKSNEFRDMTTKSIDFLLLFCIPIIVISEVYAPQIIRIIAGEGFEGAIIPMRIIIPLLFVIGYEQIIVIQMLSPLQKDNAILINSCIGAGVALLLNILLVPHYGSIGSALVWFSSELTVLVSAQFFVTKYTGYHFPFSKVIKTVFVFAPVFVACLVLNHEINNWLVSFAIGSIVVFFYFIIVECFVLKNSFLVQYLNKAIGFVSRK